MALNLSERTRKAHSLPMKKLIYLSVSQILVVSAVVALVLLNLSLEFGYSFEDKVALSIWPILLLIGSYFLYLKVEEVDFLDYLASLVMYHKLRERSVFLDMTNTLLFLGLVLITITPFLRSYALSHGHGPAYAVASLFLGGIMVATAVSGYVLLEELED